MQLQLRQIAKVVWECLRGYESTIGLADKGSWESTTQANRDVILNKVDALLRGQPHAPTSIRPTDQMKARLLSGIVGAFVLVYNPPPPPVSPAVQMEPLPVPIPVEKFPNPDVTGSVDVGVISENPVATALDGHAAPESNAIIAEANK